MAGTGLQVTLHQGRERAEVTRFTRTLDEIVRALREIDRVYLLHGTRATWVMADVTHRADDLVVRLEARLVPTKRAPADMFVPVQALIDGAETLRMESTVPRLFAPSTVRRIAKIAEPREGVQTVTLATYNGEVGRPVELTDVVRDNADAAVKPFEIAYGSVVGRLFGLRDLRTGKTLKVTVRDERRGQAIDGHVPGSMDEEVREAWRHRVILGGKVRRNAQGQPIRIDVDRIERMPEGDAVRTSTHALLGAGSEWLDGLSVDGYLKHIRDG